MMDSAAIPATGCTAEDLHGDTTPGLQELHSQTCQQANARLPWRTFKDGQFTKPAPAVQNGPRFCNGSITVVGQAGPFLESCGGQNPTHTSQNMQASLCGSFGAQENAVLAGRTEAWEVHDQQEDLSAQLAKLGLGDGKFVDGKYGSLDLFDKGLEGYVGLPDVSVFKAMMQEHASTEKFIPSNKEGTPPLLAPDSLIPNMRTLSRYPPGVNR